MKSAPVRLRIPCRATRDVPDSPRGTPPGGGSDSDLRDGLAERASGVGVSFERGGGQGHGENPYASVVGATGEVGMVMYVGLVGQTVTDTDGHGEMKYVFCLMLLVFFVVLRHETSGKPKERWCVFNSPAEGTFSPVDS